ncbi:MAG: hypothetical protein P0S95_00735 [Rhabdochlamydiaceae bacterium]|nr:hypothetical protein [Candidatus Amphrikana amoebophyrae]
MSTPIAAPNPVDVEFLSRIEQNTKMYISSILPNIKLLVLERTVEASSEVAYDELKAQAEHVKEIFTSYQDEISAHFSELPPKLESRITALQEQLKSLKTDIEAIEATAAAHVSSNVFSETGKAASRKLARSESLCENHRARLNTAIGVGYKNIIERNEHIATNPRGALDAARQSKLELDAFKGELQESIAKLEALGKEFESSPGVEKFSAASKKLEDAFTLLSSLEEEIAMIEISATNQIAQAAVWEEGRAKVAATAKKPGTETAIFQGCLSSHGISGREACAVTATAAVIEFLEHDDDFSSDKVFEMTGRGVKDYSTIIRTAKTNGAAISKSSPLRWDLEVLPFYKNSLKICRDATGEPLTLAISGHMDADAPTDSITDLSTQKYRSILRSFATGMEPNTKRVGLAQRGAYYYTVKVQTNAAGEPNYTIFDSHATSSHKLTGTRQSFVTHPMSLDEASKTTKTMYGELTGRSQFGITGIEKVSAAPVVIDPDSVSFEEFNAINRQAQGDIEYGASESKGEASDRYDEDAALKAALAASLASAGAPKSPSPPSSDRLSAALEYNIEGATSITSPITSIEHIATALSDIRSIDPARHDATLQLAIQFNIFSESSGEIVLKSDKDLYKWKALISASNNAKPPRVVGGGGGGSTSNITKECILKAVEAQSLRLALIHQAYHRETKDVPQEEFELAYGTFLISPKDSPIQVAAKELEEPKTLEKAYKLLATKL